MPAFHVNYTGDYLDAQGNLAVPDIALDLYAGNRRSAPAS